eukprot:c45863_g1_i1 orf=3-155(-)
MKRAIGQAVRLSSNGRRQCQTCRSEYLSLSLVYLQSVPSSPSLCNHHDNNC